MWKELARQFFILSKEGTQKTLQDFKFLYQKSYLFRSINKIDCPDPLQRHEIRIKKKDIFKIIPFSILIALPFSAALVFPYLYYFPNSIPRNYNRFFLEERSKRIKVERRLISYIFLKDLIDKNNYEMKTAEELEKVANFFSLEHISLIFFINQTLNLFRLLINYLNFMRNPEKKIDPVDIKFNFFPFENIRRFIMKIQVNNHVEHLLKEDELLSNFEMEAQENEEKLIIIRQYLVERGHNFEEQENNDSIKKKLMEWKKIFQDANVKSHMDYLILCMKNYKYNEKNI